MSHRLEIQGASGCSYRYVRLPDGAAPPAQGANLVVAERRRRRWCVLHVGETDYLPRSDWLPALEQARRQAPRAALFYRLNVSHGVRCGEADDIRRLHQPQPEPAGG